jgi:hypothetical protein
MFEVENVWIDNLTKALANVLCEVALIFVDLDNVPRFFEKSSSEMISSLPFETYVVCSANSHRNITCQFIKNIHFSLANRTKDAADAVCTMAAAKLDSILVQCRRQDVPLIIVSDDMIFRQVRS